MISLTTTVARHLRRALAPPVLALTLALLALVTGAGSVAAHVGVSARRGAARGRARPSPCASPPSGTCPPSGCGWSSRTG